MHPGDFIVIPAGTLHSLGKDILALEIGTNSNVTYRFHDYNRKDKDGKLRQLQLSF
jgi:mannose-6-phosphate isomerase